MNYKKVISFFVFTFFIFCCNFLQAQGCAMCKTSVESDLNTGGSIGKGLNTGILYLMTIPYIILIVGAYFFFKKPIDEKIKSWKVKFKNK